MLGKIINIKLKDDNQIVTAATPNVACFLSAFLSGFLNITILNLFIKTNSK